MIGCFYERGHWVALHLRGAAGSDDTVVVARLGDCPGDADGRDIELARRPTAGAALDRALHQLAAGWRHAGDEPPAPPAAARRALAQPTPLEIEAGADPGGRPGNRDRARGAVTYAASANGRGFCFFGNPAPH